MQNWKTFGFKIFILLLTHSISDIQAECYWELDTVQKHCTIGCTSTYKLGGLETTDQVLENLEQKWKEVANSFYFIRSVPNTTVCKRNLYERPKNVVLEKEIKNDLCLCHTK